MRSFSIAPLTAVIVTFFGRMTLASRKTCSVLLIPALLLAIGIAAGQTPTGQVGSPVPPSGPTTAVTVGPGSIAITPGSAVSVSNCIPFGDNVDFGFTGMIYRGIPAFSMPMGSTIRFDLGAMDNVNVQRNIYFATANKNPDGSTCAGNVGSQGVAALSWTKVVSDSQVPLNPKGDTIIGNYELTFTAEASFSFPGGGFIVGFGGSPPGTYADTGCDQVGVVTTCSDVSGNFYSRFFFKPDLTLGLLDDITGGGSGVALQGIIIGGTAGCPDHTVHGHIVTTPPDRHDGDSHAHAAQHGHKLLPGVVCLAAGHHVTVNGHILGLTPQSEEGLSSSRAAVTISPELLVDFVGFLNQDGVASPAARGTMVQLFGSAKGLFLDEADLLPALEFTPVASGSPLYYTDHLPEVQIGGVKAEVLFSGLAPGLKGVWQIDVRIPEGVASGNIPVSIVYENDILTSINVAVE